MVEEIRVVQRKRIVEDRELSGIWYVLCMDSRTTWQLFILSGRGRTHWSQNLWRKNSWEKREKRLRSHFNSVSPANWWTVPHSADLRSLFDGWLRQKNFHFQQAVYHRITQNFVLEKWRKRWAWCHRNEKIIWKWENVEFVEKILRSSGVLSDVFPQLVHHIFTPNACRKTVWNWKTNMWTTYTRWKPIAQHVDNFIYGEILSESNDGLSRSPQNALKSSKTWLCGKNSLIEKSVQFRRKNNDLNISIIVLTHLLYCQITYN